jgi:methylthioribose-1-phosphate isomerase
VRPVQWNDGTVRILDQTLLPHQEAFLHCRSVDEVADAIRRMAVRGAPALGIAAAFGMSLAAVRSEAEDVGALLRDLEEAGDIIIATRPTAVNIAWAASRIIVAARSCTGIDEARRMVAEEARRIASEDEEACRRMAELGADVIPPGANVLTHCNTGMLCTAGFGTAQGVIYEAHRQGKRIHVWVDKTRPMLQGARLTSWELQRLGVPMTLVADTAAGHLMSTGAVDVVIVGADRVAANGDVANKIGTYQLAVLAHHHRVPFFVAAPTSSVDLHMRSGSDISIEERAPGEVTAPLGIAFAPEGTRAINPAFDITPARLVTAIVTERGVARRPYRDSLRRLFAEDRSRKAG